MKSIKKKPIMILRMAALMAHSSPVYAHAAKATAKRSLVWTIWRVQK